ncbi:MAG: VWA domain-containing protein, partial [Planctomycetes bacterium]|nr:VWA domain-containing protein [Planctomycetota bacterium]
MTAIRNLAKTCVPVILVSFLATHVSAQKQDDSKTAIIFVVDRSGSMGQLREPDTAEAFILQAIHVAMLSQRDVKMAVVLHNGHGIKVLGDDNGAPTAALKTLQQRVIQEWESPFGGTPLDEALGMTVAMAKALPANTNTTLVNIGDGSPSSGRLRPEDFQEVQQEIDRQIQAIQARGFPPRTTEQLIQRFRAELRDPTTEEFKQLYNRQVKAEFEACLRHAALLKGKKVRFVSVDFGTPIKELRKIHQAAGGSDRDYLVVQTANRVIEALHGAGLTQLDGIVVPKPIHIPADSSTFEKTIEHQLDSVGEAAVVSIVFQSPIPKFDEHVDLSVEADGTTYAFGLQNQNPDAILSRDAAGHVAVATLVLATMPKDGTLRIRYRSP